VAVGVCVDIVMALDHVGACFVVYFRSPVCLVALGEDIPFGEVIVIGDDVR